MIVITHGLYFLSSFHLWLCFSSTNNTPLGDRYAEGPGQKNPGPPGWGSAPQPAPCFTAAPHVAAFRGAAVQGQQLPHLGYWTSFNSKAAYKLSVRYKAAGILLLMIFWVVLNASFPFPDHGSGRAAPETPTKWLNPVSFAIHSPTFPSLCSQFHS